MKLQRVLFSVVLGMLTGSASLHGEFVPRVVLLDLGGKQMTDPEFDHLGYQVTWQDENENLWVAPVDRVSGDIEMDNAEMLDTGLAPNAPIKSGTATGNGPEWVFTDKGSMILYTVQVGALGKQNWRIAVARKVLRKSGTAWKAQLLNAPEGLVGGPPDGTTVPDDPDPLFLYFNTPFGYRTLAWGHLKNPSVGGVAPFQFSSVARWASGEHVLVSTVKSSFVDQVVLFDPATPDTYTTLTFDRDFNKTTPQMWRAPEFGDNLVCFAVESPARRGNAKQIGVYRIINGRWTRFKTIIPPSSRNFPIINSPEHFVYNGHSYIVIAMKGKKKDQGTEIWLAGIDAEDFYRKVADPADGVASTDPEYLVTDSGVFIYLAQNGGKQVYRADTGL